MSEYNEENLLMVIAGDSAGSSLPSKDKLIGYEKHEHYNEKKDMLGCDFFKESLNPSIRERNPDNASERLNTPEEVSLYTECRQALFTFNRFYSIKQYLCGFILMFLLVLQEAVGLNALREW